MEEHEKRLLRELAAVVCILNTSSGYVRDLQKAIQNFDFIEAKKRENAISEG